MKHNRGFTLIEMLVVLGIMMTTTGIVMVNYNNFNTTEKLKQTSRNLRNDLRFVQTRASAGLKPVGATCTTLRGYLVSFTQYSYRYEAVCSEGLVNPVTVALPSDVTFPVSPSSIMFNVLTGTSNNTVTIPLAAGGRGYELQVSPSGDINDLGVKPVRQPEYPMPTVPPGSCGNIYSAIFGPTILLSDATPIEAPTCGTADCPTNKRRRLFCSNGTLFSACRNQYDTPPAQSCPQ